MLIGVGQGGPLGCHRHPQMLQCPSQQARPPQISRNECARPNWQNSLAMNWPQLVKPRACRSALCSFDRLFEISARKQLQHLRENAAYFIHRLTLLRLNWFLSRTQSSVSGGSASYQKRHTPRPSADGPPRRGHCTIHGKPQSANRRERTHPCRSNR
jgi:hypothetical protein